MSAELEDIQISPEEMEVEGTCPAIAATKGIVFLRVAESGVVVTAESPTGADTEGFRACKLYHRPNGVAREFAVMLTRGNLRLPAQQSAQ